MRYSLYRIYVLVESAITNLISIIEIRASILYAKTKGRTEIYTRRKRRLSLIFVATLTVIVNDDLNMFTSVSH